MPPEDQEDIKPGARTKLQRCQHGVYYPEYGSEDCGEPAVATWDWGSGPLYVCDKHDAEIEQQEDVRHG